MLTEERRKQLDEIVRQMSINNEPSDNIQFVVDDFKQKYSEPETPVQETERGSTLGNLGKGLVKSVVDPLQNIGNIVAKPVGKLFGTEEEDIGFSEETLQRKGTAQKVGGFVGDVAQLAIPAAKIGKISKLSKLGKTGLRAASTGGIISAQEGKVGPAAGVGAGLEFVLPGLGIGARTLGNQIKGLPTRFVNSALKRSKKDVLADIAKDKTDDFAKYVLDKKPIGTADKLANESIDSVVSLSKKIQTKLGEAFRKTGKPVTIGRDNLLDDIVKTPEAEGALLGRKEIRAIIEKLAPQSKKLLQKSSLNLQEANSLRQLLDGTLGDKAFLGGQLTSDKKILKNFANILRESVKTKAPKEVRSMFVELANEIRFRDGMLDRIASKQGNQVLSFGDFIGGGLGGYFGGGFGGAGLGIAARRIIESVPFKLSSAKFIQSLTKAGPIIDKLADVEREAIIKLIVSGVSDNDQQSDQQRE